ncbi:MAG: hypothetical protein ABUS57_02115 [Pseudomonadota bacterium]
MTAHRHMKRPRNAKRTLKVNFAPLFEAERRERERLQRLYDAPDIPLKYAVLCSTPSDSKDKLRGHVYVLYLGDPRGWSLEHNRGACDFCVWAELTELDRLLMLTFFVEHWLPDREGIPASRGRRALMRIPEYRALAKDLPSLLPRVGKE